MTKNQIRKVLQEYLSLVQDDNFEVDGFNDAESTSSMVEHIKYMCKEAQEFLNYPADEDWLWFEKANRWLGFIQGAFWALNVFSIDEMRDHNDNRRSIL